MQFRLEAEGQDRRRRATTVKFGRDSAIPAAVTDSRSELSPLNHAAGGRFRSLRSSRHQLTESIGIRTEVPPCQRNARTVGRASRDRRSTAPAWIRQLLPVGCRRLRRSGRMGVVDADYLTARARARGESPRSGLAGQSGTASGSRGRCASGQLPRLSRPMPRSRPQHSSGLDCAAWARIAASTLSLICTGVTTSPRRSSPCPCRRRCTATRRRGRRRASASTCTSVVSTRAPLAPIGCPSAMAPPWTLTLAGSSFSSRTTASDWAANASFSSITSRSARPMSGAIRRLPQGGDRSDAHHHRIDPGGAVRRRSARAAAGRSSWPTSRSQ